MRAECDGGPRSRGRSSRAPPLRGYRRRDRGVGGRRAVVRHQGRPLDVYWMSYYTADYTHGFVRRGLAGELVRLAPRHYFGATLSLRWLSTVVYLGGLATVSGVVLFSGHRSGRRVMVATVMPLLPFGVPFAAFSARPDLFGGAALAAFSSALALTRSRTVATAWCATYGVVIAALTLVHEAIGLQFALGAFLAVIVLGAALETAQRRGMLLAVLPGVLTTAVVAAFGRHDIAAQLCAAVPPPGAQPVRHGHLTGDADALCACGTTESNRLSRLGVSQRDAELRQRNRRRHPNRRPHRRARAHRFVDLRRLCRRGDAVGPQRAGVPLRAFVETLRGELPG